MPGGATSAGYYYENKGQIIDDNGTARPGIKYYSEKGAARLWFADGMVHHTLRKAGDSVGGTLAPDTSVRLDVRFDCTNWQGDKGRPCAEMKVYTPSTDFLNYFLPHCGAGGITGVRGYKTVVYENAFAGIDVRYTADASGPVMYFVVHPGANPADIKLVMAGQDSLLQWVGGSLRAALGQQSILFPKGTVYQIDGGGNPYVVPSWFATWYEVNDSTVGLNTGPYTGSDVLVIKVAGPPVVTSTTAQGQAWGTYHDGNGNYLATAASVAVERYDNNSSTTPPLPGAVGLFSAQAQNTNNFAALNGIQPQNLGLSDFYIAKFNGDYVRQWATYYGGDGNEVPTGIALDSGSSSGIYIVGTSSSSNLNIPSPNGGTFYQSSGPGFIGKFSKQTGQRTWISKIGGGLTQPEAVDIDFKDDRLYVVGSAYSAGTAFPTPLPGNFPVGNNSGQPTRYLNGGGFGGSGSKGFVMEFLTATNALNWSTLLGYETKLLAVKKWNSGTDSRLWVGGVTNNILTDPLSHNSPQTAPSQTGPVAALANPSTTNDYFQSALAASPSTENFEGYLAAFNSDFSLEWGTYYGGEKNDVISSLALAPNGDLLVAGTTQTFKAAASSTMANNVGQFPLYDHPTNADYFSGTHASNAAGYPGQTDDFFARISTDYQLRWSTYFGGAGNEGGGPSAFSPTSGFSIAAGAPAIATDEYGNIIVGSTTQKPATGEPQPTGFPMLSLGTNIYYQPDNASAADQLAAADCYFAMFGTANQQKWTTHFGGGDGTGPTGLLNPNPGSPRRADELMADVAVLSGQRIYGYLTTQSAATPTQQPTASPTGIPYFDNTIGGPNGDPFLTAFLYNQYATGVVADPSNYASAFGLAAAPNPTSDAVRIEFSLPAAVSASLTLSDATGRVITTRTVQGRENSNRTTLDLRNVSAGLYFIQLSTATGHEAIKIVKQ